MLHTKDIHTGDFVGVFTTNAPEMVVTIYALSKLGAVAALINTNLRGMEIRRLLCTVLEMITYSRFFG
mgnify:CR=1 FL=1